MKKQWLVVAAVLVVLSAGAVLGARLAPDIFPVEVGSKAPSFRAVDVATGDSVSLDSLRGEVVLLNIWATWCAPCREEMPSMERLHAELGPRGLRVVAVSVDTDGADQVRAFRDEYRLSFTIFQDRTRSIERTYQTTGVPETFVINRDGRIVKKVIGAYDWSSPAAKELIERLLAQRG